ncbi:MAG: hypothetical protein Q9181_008275 [Wetmoreana brouardii]
MVAAHLAPVLRPLLRCPANGAEGVVGHVVASDKSIFVDTWPRVGEMAGSTDEVHEGVLTASCVRVRALGRHAYGSCAAGAEEGGDGGNEDKALHSGVLLGADSGDRGRSGGGEDLCGEVVEEELMGKRRMYVGLGSSLVFAYATVVGPTV